MALFSMTLGDPIFNILRRLSYFRNRRRQTFQILWVGTSKLSIPETGVVRVILEFHTRTANVQFCVLVEC